MIKTRRRTFPIGRSTGVTLPGGMDIAEEVSMAAGRLIIIDPTGRIPEDKLLQILGQHIEPHVSRWEAESLGEASPGGGIRAQQARAEPREAVVVLPPQVTPGPPIYDVTCPRCQGGFRWDLERGYVGFCPYCGLRLKFIGPR